MRYLSWPLVTVIILSFVFNVAAGEITLKNGDRLTGKIVDESDEAIVIETEYAGKVTIARSHIERVVNSDAKAAAKPTVPPLAAAKVEKPADVAPAGLVGKQSPSGLGGRIKRIATGWEGTANIGFSYTSGNSNNITMTTGLRAVKPNPEGGMLIYFRSLWNNTHGASSVVTTQNAFWGGARYDRNLTKKMFGFLSYDFERDKPRRLSFRSVVGGGLGHRTVKNDRTELELLAGLAWNRTWQAGADSDTPEGLVGLNFKQKINHRFRVQNAFTYFQNVTDGNEYRVLFDTSFTADVTPKIGVYFAIGNRYNNDPLGSAKKNDFLLTTGLKWNFGKKK
ncbi:MAG: DUF481 domain-containing protein [Acidobacteria bacterium]|jgi:putative salt-induced outer membrane protein|nr:DUF481 domain-containing protein [Acidobacteriota bacterium]MBK9527644.1 DUF481 domain-containing protein [Acidobacteriota bacterium]MBP7475362.1 DUF481 domain-containing protein [Pyrinomonadaceae bacterium]MBP9108734.1 DUF481 domain-containing protein [Pyrinomonadaceae bacterium]